MFSIGSNTAPIHEQIQERIEKLILGGALEKDSPLPSVREMACELAINPNTVQKAYTALEQAGITYSVSGKGRFVGITADGLKAKKAEAVFSCVSEKIKELYSFGLSLPEISEKLNKLCKEAEHCD